MEKWDFNWSWKDNKICIDGGKGKWACGAQVTEGTEAAVGKLLSGGSLVGKCAC